MASITPAKVKAAAMQLTPVLYSRDGTVERVVQKIHELGRLGVQFAVFSEKLVPYYPYFSFIQPAYQIASGHEHHKLLEQWVTIPSPNHQRSERSLRAGGCDRSDRCQRARRRHHLQHRAALRCRGTLLQRRRKIFPTTPCAAPPIERQRKFEVAGKDVPDTFLARHTYPSNSAGVPAISLPMALTAEGLPLGMELAAPAGRDRELLALAHRVERIIGRPLPR